MKIDVRLGDRGAFGDTPPLMRELLSFKITRKKDTGTTAPGWYRWVHWYWKPESGLADLGNNSGYDCGYSGIREDHASFHAAITTLTAHKAISQG